MLVNQNPDCTLADVFYPVFYQTIHQPPQVINPAIERFYREVFPKLKSLTRPMPQAVGMVEAAFARGYQDCYRHCPSIPPPGHPAAADLGWLQPRAAPFCPHSIH